MEEIQEKDIQSEKTYHKEKKKSIEDKILLKQQELQNLRKAYAEEQKKEKKKWANIIIKPVKEEVEKLYEKDNMKKDVEVCAVLLYAIENYKSLLSNIEVEKYVIKEKIKIERVKSKESD